MILFFKIEEFQLNGGEHFQYLDGIGGWAKWTGVGLTGCTPPGAGD